MAAEHERMGLAGPWDLLLGAFAGSGAAWARERYRARGQIASVIGAVVQLGRCFDLLNEGVTAILADRYLELARTFAEAGRSLPRNHGRQAKRRDLDCLVISHCLDELQKAGTEFDTVRGAFLEGKPAYPGAGFSREGHIQIAVRNSTCILGVFRPNWLS